MTARKILGPRAFDSIINNQKALGKSDDEIKAIVTTQAQEAYTKQGLDKKHDTITPKPLLHGDTTIDKIGRGFAEATARGAAVANWVDDKLLDNKYISDEFANKNAKVLDTLEEIKQKDSRKGLDGNRIQELNTLDNKIARADGVWENAKVGLQKMYDVVSHPKEWTIQGTVAGIVPTDPANAISIVTGGIGGVVIKKLGGSLASKLSFATADGVLSGGVAEYGVAKGSNKTDKEAQKALYQGATVGALTTVPMATGATLLPSMRKYYTQKDIDPKQSTIDLNNNLKKTTNHDAINDELKKNTLLQSKDEEIVKDIQELANIEQKGIDQHNFLKEELQKIKNNGGTLKDMKDFVSSLEVAPEEYQISRLINNGIEPDSTLAGFRIVSVLQDTIKNSSDSPEVIYNKLVQDKFVQKDLAKAFVQSYKEKTPETLVDFINDKIHGKLDEKYNIIQNNLANTIDLYNLEHEANDNNWKNSVPKHELDTFIEKIAQNEKIPQEQINLVYELNKLGFVDELTHENLKTKTGEYATGVYDKKEGKIHIDDSSPFGAENMQTLIHEYVHSASSRLLIKDDSFRADIETIMNDVQSKVSEEEKSLYGFTNAEEFVAEAYSNPEFAKILSETKIDDKTRSKLNIKETISSVWDLVVDRFMESIYKTTGKRINFDADSHMATLNELMANKIQELEDIKTKKIQDGSSLESNLNEPDVTIAPKKYNPDDTSFENMTLHPRFEELIEMRQGVKASEIRSKQKLVHRGHLVKDNDKYNGEDKTSYVPDTFEPNYLADFDLTMKDVKNIRAGKITPTIIAKLQRDLATLDNDPNYALGEENSRTKVDKKSQEDRYSYKLEDPKNTKEQLEKDTKDIDKNWQKKMDNLVNTIYYDGIFTAPDIILEKLNVKDGLEAIGIKGASKANWFKITEMQNKINDVINDFKIAKGNIYDQANGIRKSLEELSVKDNQDLLRVLNGDIKAKNLSPELQKIYKIFRDRIDANANELVKLGLLKEDEKIKDYVKRYYKQYMEDAQDFKHSVAYSKLKKRKDLTYDEAVEIGMVEDAGFTIANTISEQNIMIQKAKVLKTLADTFGKDEVDFDDGVPSDYIKMSNETVKSGVFKWGALAGKYVPKELKKELENARIIEHEFRMFEDGLYPLVDHLKVNMTVKNPATHLYNIGSNMLLSFLNGDMESVGKLLYMRYAKPKKFEALVKRANEFGLNSFLDDVEERQISLQVGSKKKVNIIATIFKELYMSQGTKIGNVARKLYDWEDKIFKLAGFYKHIQNGVDDKTAFKYSSEVYVDYSTPLPSALRFLDKGGFMPFLHYQYKATPAVAKVVLKHPIRSLILGTGIAAIGGLRWQDEDDKYLKPEWADDRMISMFGMKEWTRIGNGYYFNSGRIVPGTKLDFDLGGFWKGMSYLTDGKTPLGYTFIGKYDSAMEKYAKTILTAMENYLPSLTYGRYAQRFAKIGLGDADIIEAPKNKVTGEDDTVKEVVQRALGVRKFNEPKEARRFISEAKKQKKHDDEKGADPKETQAVVDEVEKQVKKALAKFDLNIDQDKTKTKKDGFDFNPKMKLDF